MTTSKLLFAKIFTLKQKTNQILSATLEKNRFCYFEKTVHDSFRYIHTYSDIFRHI